MQIFINPIITKRIFTPSGEISKDKINLIAGAMTLPVAEIVWVTTSGSRAMFIRGRKHISAYALLTAKQQIHEKPSTRLWKTDTKIVS